MTETYEMRQYRRQQIAQAEVYKGKRCDWVGCTNHKDDCHELIHRSMTVGNDDARRLSFQKELCAQLCRKHHERAHNPAVTFTLLAQNCRIYGYEQVLATLGELETAMKSHLSISFPSKEDVECLTPSRN